MTIAQRVLLADFALANPLYANARVWVYEATVATGLASTTLATLYRAPTGTDEEANPFTLDSQGKLQRGVYVDAPVVARVTDALVPVHDTGVIGLISRFREEWERDASYLVGDTVRDGSAGAATGNLYVCRVSHEATDTWLVALNRGVWTLYLEAGTSSDTAGGTGDVVRIQPEQFGAIGDGVSRTPIDYLGLTTGDQLRSYNDGQWSFATDDDLDAEVDTLAIQAALRHVGLVVGKPGAHYRINRPLFLSAGRTSANFETCLMDCTSFVPEPQSTIEYLTNPTLDGQTGWVQGTLTPRTDIVFTGGAAVFTDPAVGEGSHYGDFGQLVTLQPGRYSVRLHVEITPGASFGYYGPPYINAGFRPFGIGLGGYEWPHPLAAASLNIRVGPYDQWFQFDFEVTEETTTWLDIQGGNCNWKIKEAHINPFRMNYVVWCTGDDVLGLGAQRFDVSWWTGGDFIGPVYGTSTQFLGSDLNCFLHKSFRGEGARCSMERVFIYGFNQGITFSSQAFLHHIISTNVGSCRTCLLFQAGSVNAGENLRFTACVIFNSALALHGEGGGEWNFYGSSFDFNWRDVLLEKAAKVKFSGHHFEFAGNETRLFLTPTTGIWDDDAEAITGLTSGATGRIIINRTGDDVPHVVLEVLTGTFAAGETVQSELGDEGETTAEVQFGVCRFELRGGSLVDFSGEFIQLGGEHRGAAHMFLLQSLEDKWENDHWWAYGLRTASDVLVTGHGRFLSRNFMGPGNANLPSLIHEHHAADIFAGNGRILGAGTMELMGFAGPADGIGLIFGAHSNSAPRNRAQTDWEQLVSADATVFRTAGGGSLKLAYNAAYSGGVELRIFAPVQPTDAVLWRYFYSKPDAKPDITHGPYISGAAPDDIKISTTADLREVRIRDAQSAASFTYGPQGGWTVTLANVTGNPGGIADAVWNGTHTILRRVPAVGTVVYEIQMPTAALTTETDVGGTTIEATYLQTNIVVFVRQFWVQVAYFDEVSRPVFLNAAYQGEKTIFVNHAAQDWTQSGMVTHYSEPLVPEAEPLVDLSANGRAPAWATHLMLLWNWQEIRQIDPLAPPPLYIADLFGNRI